MDYGLAVKSVVLIPSLGRPGSDFDLLAESLREASFNPVAIDPRPQFPDRPNLHDLALDTIHQIDDMGIESFHLVGHAFGNRLSRCVAADFPERVLSLTLLAAGGLVEPPAEIWQVLFSCYDRTLSDEDHIDAVRTAFFAEGNDPSSWRDGWYPEIMKYQRGAVTSTPREDWWNATVSRVLVIQALQDAIAPVENGRRYQAESAPHAQLVEIDGSGHAMLPEQPDAIASALIAFLRGVPNIY
jgi:pimeloyl-ACP methyl ester carboxylesterase